MWLELAGELKNIFLDISNPIFQIYFIILVQIHSQHNFRWEGFKIKVNAPSNTILLGAKGSTSAGNINKLVDESVKNDYLGVMVWYASVKNGLQYGGGSWDASTSPSTQEAYINGMKRFQNEL